MRQLGLQGTALATAQPKTVILSLFKIAVRVKQYKDRLEIVSAERIRDEINKLITVESPSAGLWFLVETGLADKFLPELPAMRLEHDPIHRHKDVLTHTLAVIENVHADARNANHWDPSLLFRRLQVV